jgi:hypothetical protein
MTATITENVPLAEGFQQVCVWPGTIIGDKIDEFVQWGLDEFGVRFQYLEEIKTKRDETGPGGRNDVLFAIHNEDVGKFSIPRLQYGMRWIEDVYGNNQGHLYPERVADYKCWDAGNVDDGIDDTDE